MIRSIFAPLVGGVKTRREFEAVDHSKDKLISLVDPLTASRPVLAGHIALKLKTGTGKVRNEILVMAATDMEGKVARAVDKVLPGYGSTEHGEKFDVFADTLALGAIGVGMVAGRRVSTFAKMGAGIVLGQEVGKVGWYAVRNMQHKRATGNAFDTPVTADGKSAMAEKFTALALGGASHDAETSAAREAYGLAALGMAVMGSLRGEQARRSMEEDFQRIMHGLTGIDIEPPAPVNIHELLGA